MEPHTYGNARSGLRHSEQVSAQATRVETNKAIRQTTPTTIGKSCIPNRLLLSQNQNTMSASFPRETIRGRYQSRGREGYKRDLKLSANNQEHVHPTCTVMHLDRTAPWACASRLFASRQHQACAPVWRECCT